jgi:hypothetical protein
MSLSTRIRNDPQNQRLLEYLAHYREWNVKPQRHFLHWILEDLSESEVKNVINNQSEHLLRVSFHTLCREQASFELINLYKDFAWLMLQTASVHSLQLMQYLLTRGIYDDIDDEFMILPDAISLCITCGVPFRIGTPFDVKMKHSRNDVLLYWGISFPEPLGRESGMFALWVHECGNDAAQEEFQEMFTRYELFAIKSMDFYHKDLEEPLPGAWELLTENIEYLEHFFTDLVDQEVVLDPSDLSSIYYAIICHVVEHNEYIKLHELQNSGLRIDSYSCGIFCRKHPIYEFWKKVASSIGLRVTVLCEELESDQLPITFWVDLIKDYSPEKVLADLQEMRGDGFLKEYCIGVMKHNKYREAQRIQGKLLPKVRLEED